MCNMWKDCALLVLYFYFGIGTDEEKLVLALCKFCEGSNECNNLTAGSFSEPPTFLGRAWMQLIECGGVALLVSLLHTHRHNTKLRPAILRAILGVEHNYSYRDTVSFGTDFIPWSIGLFPLFWKYSTQQVL